MAYVFDCAALSPQGDTNPLKIAQLWRLTLSIFFKSLNLLNF
jgi:hypothetical protein